MSSPSDPDATPRSGSSSPRHRPSGEPSPAQRKRELTQTRASEDEEVRAFARRVCVHEAGHGCAACVEGVFTHLIWSSGVRGKTIASAKSAFFAVSGCAGEMLVYGDGHLSDADRGSALAALGIPSDSPDAEPAIDEEIRKARVRLAPHRRAIEALAAALEQSESGQIGRDEIQAIFQEASRG